MTLVLALTASLLASEAVPEPIVQAVEQVVGLGSEELDRINAALAEARGKLGIKG